MLLKKQKKLFFFMGFQDMPIKTYVDFGWISYFHWNCSDKLNPGKSG
jgi:hypothetical protein